MEDFNEVGSTDDILSGDVAERIAEMMGGLGLSAQASPNGVAPDLEILLDSLKDFRSKLSGISSFDENE